MTTRRGGTDTYFNGVALALSRLNTARPRTARPLAMRRPPTDSGDLAVAAAFRDDPTIVGVVGHTGSAQTMDAAPIYADLEHEGDHPVLAITPTATNPQVTRVTRWVFRVCPTDNDAARALARFAVDSMGAGTHRLAVVYRNDLFGRGFQHAFADEMGRLGRASSVIERDPYLSGLTEYDAYAARIVARKVDVLVVAGSAADAADIVRAIRRARGQVRVLGSDDVGALSQDSAAAREFRGLRYTSFFNPSNGSEFVEAYRRTFGVPPDQRAALAYDAATLLGLAEFAVGPDRRRIRDWVAAVGRTAPSVAGVTGQIRFSDSTGGDPVDKPITVGVIQ
ncbi:MAG TPA: ABC transporter substrate-binding protein [Gemmatimonadaceae bacterium]|nr:ABC transporter substrate-binding protein [Gemmatimonadaceae bacterium]